MRKVFDTLYEKGQRGKTKIWNIEVSGTKAGPAEIKVSYGTEGDKIRVTTKEITKGKNLGKSNETTPYEQACLEAESTWKKKQDEGYVLKLKDLDDFVLLPMLAHKWAERKKDIVFPAAVQPKLDGVRSIATGQAHLSRGGKPFDSLGHLDPWIKKLGLKNLDGEIYSHDYTFQEVVSFVKKLRPESKELEYWIFDLAIPKVSFAKRREMLVDAFKNLKDQVTPLRLVPTFIVNSEKEIMEYHKQFVGAGFEGIMIRNLDSEYKFKDRSKDLLKYKDFSDNEFEIVGGVSGLGTEKGCVVFEVKDEKGNKFPVRPRGTFDKRKEWLKNIKDLIGKKLTVRYQGFTNDGLPRFPVGIGIRDYE